MEPAHFDGFLDRQRFAKDVAGEVRPLLTETLRERPLDQRAVYQLIEELVDAKLDNR